MLKIFISYNHRNMALTTNLANDLKELDNTVWFDHELGGGQVWWDKILTTIRECDLFVFVLDPDALNSVACMREYGYAYSLKKRILPILVSDHVSLNLLPPALSQIQFVDYRKQNYKAALRLAKALYALPPPQPLPDPLPDPPEAPLSYLGSLAEHVDSASELSREQQIALIFDLKKSLRDDESCDDTCILLQRLRKRPDLLASIAEEIDELLESAGNGPSSPPGSETPHAGVDAETSPIKNETEQKSSAETKKQADTVSKDKDDPKKDTNHGVSSGLNLKLIAGLAVIVVIVSFTAYLMYKNNVFSQFNDNAITTTTKPITTTSEPTPTTAKAATTTTTTTKPTTTTSTTKPHPTVRLRDKPASLNQTDVKAMLKKHHFFDSDWNKSGDFKNHFKDNGNGAVSDRATGLMWQQSGSDESMKYKEAPAYVQKLNQERFAGYDDWRLPTLEELASLLESEKSSNGLYIDPIFDAKHWRCWTADTRRGSSGLAWVVSFNFGNVNSYNLSNIFNYVRVVRAGQ